MKSAIPLRRIADSDELDPELAERVLAGDLEGLDEVVGCYTPIEDDGGLRVVIGHPIRARLLRITGETGKATLSEEKAVFSTEDGRIYTNWENLC